MTGNPDATMVAPGPIARGPIPAHAIIPIPRPMAVIGAVADIDRDPDRLGRRRNNGSGAEEQGQQKSKFVSHTVYLSSYFD